MPPFGDTKQYFKKSSPAAPTFRQSPPSMPADNNDSS